METGANHYPRTAGEQTGAKLSVILKTFSDLLKLRRHIRLEGLDAAGTKKDRKR